MESVSKRKTIKDFRVLIALFLLITGLTAAHGAYYGFSMRTAHISMSLFFLIFGFLKLINLRAFAHAYATYDIIAQRFSWYGYIYPCIELGLGIAYLQSEHLFLINIITLVLMLINACGVFLALHQGRDVDCACLGMIFKLPMTTVSLAEDLIMAVMAFIMLLMHAS